MYLPDQSLVNFFRSSPDSFSNIVADCLDEIDHLYLTPFRKAFYASITSELHLQSLSGPELSMVLASAYAISSLSRAELCSATYGSQFPDDPITVLPISECFLSNFLLTSVITGFRIYYKTAKMINAVP